MQKNGLLSYVAPLARELIGEGAGRDHLNPWRRGGDRQDRKSPPTPERLTTGRFRRRNATPAHRRMPRSSDRKKAAALRTHRPGNRGKGGFAIDVHG